MTGALRLAAAHAAHHAWRTALLALCVAVAALVPLGTWVVSRGFEARLRERAAGTPLVAGSSGSRFDLVLAALHFRPTPVKGVSMAEFDRLAAMRLGEAVPVNTVHTSRGAPVVATSPEYFQRRGLAPRAGTLPLLLGDATLGNDVARRFDLKPGDAIFSDQRELYDISRPAALKMRVVGVLAPSGTSDDEAVFVDIRTAWVIDGLLHAHADPRGQVAPDLVVERSDANVNLSEALIEFNEVTPENIDSYHLHARPEELPLTAVLLFPPDDKSATILKARVNQSRGLQACVPSEIVEEMLLYVLRVRRVLWGVGAVLVALTAGMLGLIGVLSVRLRERELASLERIGAPRSTLAAVVLAEHGLVLMLGGVLAGLGTLALAWAAVDLIKFL